MAQVSTGHSRPNPLPEEITPPRFYGTPWPHKNGHVLIVGEIISSLCANINKWTWNYSWCFNVSRKMELIHRLSYVKVDYFVLDSCSPQGCSLKWTRPKNLSKDDFLQPAFHYLSLVTKSSAERKRRLKLINAHLLRCVPYLAWVQLELDFTNVSQLYGVLSCDSPEMTNPLPMEVCIPICTGSKWATGCCPGKLAHTCSTRMI